MGANKIPIDKSMTKEKAIKQGGYYNTDGDWNNIIVLNEYPDKILRGRVETLILKDGKLFMFLKDNNTYRIPGGGFDKGVLNIDQAFMETKEEAKIIIDNIRYSGVSYVHIYDEIWKKSDDEISYDGTYNEVYVADFKDNYHGYIRKGLSDMELTNKGQFYDLDDVKNILKEPHKQALQNILNGVIKENTENELYSIAMDLQTLLMHCHQKYNKFTCVNNIDIESDDGGYIFAQYNIISPKEKKQVVDFIQFCNCSIKNTTIVEEPITYGSYGFLFIKYKDKV